MLLYTLRQDLIFVHDKWAEWSTNRSSIIPKNIQKGVMVTHVADNIDFKNKSIQPGRETHNTNSILIHVGSNAKSTPYKTSLTPDYNFKRKDHRSFKGTPLSYQNYLATKERSTLEALNRVVMNSNAEIDASAMKNLAWVMCRTRNETSDDVKVQAWSAFQKGRQKKMPR